MKRLAILLIASALAWSGYWLFQAQQTRSSVEAWFNARQSDGWDASYSDLSLRGFPNRLDLTLSDLVLHAPDAPRLTAPFLQSFQLVYRPGHRIFALPETMTLGETTVTSQGLRASLVETSGLIDRANLEAEVLNIAAEGSTLALAGVRAAFLQQAPDTYQLAIAADGLAGPEGPIAGGASDGLRFNARVTFDRPWRSEQLAEARPQPTRIALDLLEYEQATLTLKLAGTLEIDPDGRATGRVTLRAENWRALLTSAQEAKQIPPAMAQAMAEGLTLYSRLTGNGQDLDLPLDFTAGELRLGPIPLGQTMRFRVP